MDGPRTIYCGSDWCGKGVGLSHHSGKNPFTTVADTPPWRLILYVNAMLRRYQRARPPGKGEKASWAYRLKLLLLDIQEKASQVTGETNNRTEQVIGRAFKIRTRTMRGFKRRDNRIRFLNLALALDARAQCEGVIYLL